MSAALVTRVEVVLGGRGTPPFEGIVQVLVGTKAGFEATEAGGETWHTC